MNEPLRYVRMQISILRCAEPVALVKMKSVLRINKRAVIMRLDQKEFCKLFDVNERFD